MYPLVSGTALHRRPRKRIFTGECWRGTTKPNGWLPFLFFIPFKASPRESWRVNWFLRVLSLFLHTYGISFSFIFSHFQLCLFLFYTLDLSMKDAGFRVLSVWTVDVFVRWPVGLLFGCSDVWKNIITRRAENCQLSQLLHICFGFLRYCAIESWLSILFCWWFTADIEYRVHTCQCVIRFPGLVSVVQFVRPTFTPAPGPAAHVSSWTIRPAMTCRIYGHASIGMIIQSNNTVWLDAQKQCTTHTVLSFQPYYCATWKCESQYLIHFRILLLQIYPCTFLNLLIRILRAPRSASHPRACVLHRDIEGIHASMRNLTHPNWQRCLPVCAQ